MSPSGATGWRRDFAERKLFTGRWGHGVLLARPTGRLVVRFGRTGVKSAGGFGCLFPAWFLSRIAWQADAKSWTVTVTTTGPTRWQANHFVTSVTAPTRDEGRAALRRMLDRIDAGEFDDRAR